LNDSAGNKISGITGTYSFWADENILYFVPNHKILGGYFMPYISINVANGSLVADIVGTNLSANGGGGLADLYVEPINIGWHFAKRVDFNVGYSFVAPTGRYTAAVGRFSVDPLNYPTQAKIGLEWATRNFSFCR
jgi:Putative MetA-pathway of phenol degradation